MGDKVHQRRWWILAVLCLLPVLAPRTLREVIWVPLSDSDAGGAGRSWPSSPSRPSAARALSQVAMTSAAVAWGHSPWPTSLRRQMR